jgi:Apea-like HEPN
VANNRLDGWVGRSVGMELVQYGRTLSYTFGATLESADERGIVVRFGNQGDIRRGFFPWHNVRYLHLLEEISGSRPSGEQAESQSASEVPERPSGGGGSRGAETRFRQGANTNPELHPEAAKSFNEKAQALLAQVGPATAQEPSEFPTHLARPGAAAHEIADEDVIDFKILGQSDLSGTMTARYFEHEGQRFGLEGEQYKELARLSERLQRRKELRDIVSVKWVEDVIISWMKEKQGGTEVPELTDFLVKRCEEDVKEHEIWFPIANLSLESDLPFGHVVFKTISKEMLDRVEEDGQKSKEGRDEEYAAMVDRQVLRLRHDLQGLAASTIKVGAEPQRAYEIALEESERAVATLGLYHVAATTMPEMASYSAPLGTENMEQIRYLEVEEGNVRKDHQKPGPDKPVVNFHLSDEDISRFKATMGFDNVNELLTLERRTSFQETLLDALLLYSRSTREKDLAGRFVYMFAAIESVLLRNDTEPIQQNVGDRMAFLIIDDSEKRRAAVRNLKATYTLRSNFVHHGHTTIDELDTVKTFMTNSWALFLRLAKDSHRYQSKEQLIDHLEDMKYYSPSA